MITAEMNSNILIIIEAILITRTTLYLLSLERTFLCKAKTFQLMTGDVLACYDEEHVSRLPTAAICEDVFPHGPRGENEETL